MHAWGQAARARHLHFSREILSSSLNPHGRFDQDAARNKAGVMCTACGGALSYLRICPRHEESKRIRTNVKGFWWSWCKKEVQRWQLFSCHVASVCAQIPFHGAHSLGSYTLLICYSCLCMREWRVSSGISWEFVCLGYLSLKSMRLVLELAAPSVVLGGREGM
jgi:hypothetical protein